MDARFPELSYFRSETAVAPRFCDVFAGCGGLSLGLMKSGWEGLFAIEKNADAFQTLKSNLVEDGSRKKFDWPSWLPKTPHDITTFLKDYGNNLKPYIGNVDLMVGGPPCQGFSTAGRRNPDDPRSQLTIKYLELVEHLKPTIVLIENVQGITTDFDDQDAPNGKLNYSSWIQETLSEDYVVSAKVLNTSNFGVPQLRKRFFIIAHRKDKLREGHSFDPFAKIESQRMNFLKSKALKVPVSSKQALSDLEVTRGGTKPSPDTKNFLAIRHSSAKTRYQKLMKDGHSGAVPDTRLAKHKPHIVERFERIIEDTEDDQLTAMKIPQKLREEYGLKKNVIRVLSAKGPAPTITSMPDDLIHYSEPRALTVRENARLQSFPDWFAFQGKYTTGGLRRRIDVPRFTQVANAVPPLAAEAIGRSLLSILKNSLWVAGVEGVDHSVEVLTEVH